VIATFALPPRFLTGAIAEFHERQEEIEQDLPRLPVEDILGNKGQAHQDDKEQLCVVLRLTACTNV